MANKIVTDEVKKLIDPYGVPGPRVHSIRRWLGGRDGTRLAGFVLHVEKDPRRRREPTTFRLEDLERGSR